MLPTGTIAYYDVVINGAGPAGCTGALALKDAGLKVALLDKSTFPRDKVCGDAIPLRALKALRKIDPAYEAAFKAFPFKLQTRGTAVIYKNRRLVFNWVGDSYTCARMEFDNFLYSLVKESTTTILYSHVQPEKIVREPGGFTISLNNGDVVKTKMLIGADGAHSAVAKQLTHRQLDRAHYVGSVRAYYDNIGGIGDGITEIYFNKNFIPSYLWVFPLPGNRANVGFGMLSSEIARQKVDIKKAFYEFIAQSPALREKFKDAVQAGALQGFGLPLGSKTGIISGDNFMLAGDAASLVDPITGEGIGNAMLSGRLAGEQVIRCFGSNDLSAGHMQRYDRELMSAIGKELKMRYRAQRLLSRFPFLVDIAFFAGKNKFVKRMIQKQF